MHCHRDVGAGQQCLPGGGLPTPPDLAKNTNKHQRLQPSCCNEGWALGNLRRMERMEVDGGTDRLMRAAAVACRCHFTRKFSKLLLVWMPSCRI